jgi:hypothetical protein
MKNQVRVRIIWYRWRTVVARKRMMKITAAPIDGV